MLTVVEIRNANPKERPYKIADGKGLYLFILPNGRKSWRYRYRFNGKESIFIIGEFPETSLEDARAGRAAARALLKGGRIRPKSGGSKNRPYKKPKKQKGF